MGLLRSHSRRQCCVWQRHACCSGAEICLDPSHSQYLGRVLAIQMCPRTNTARLGQVETIVISVISMLSDPTDESPANLDAAVRTSRSCLARPRMPVLDHNVHVPDAAR
jgi:hypothetical protein